MNDDQIIYYRARLDIGEDGHHITIEEWHSIHSTDCYDWCVQVGYLDRLRSTAAIQGLSLLKAARKNKWCKVKRIASGGGRFAQMSKQGAFEKMLYLKKRQVGHLTRELAVLQAFIDAATFETLQENGSWLNGDHYYRLPQTQGVINKHYRFD